MGDEERHRILQRYLTLMVAQGRIIERESEFEAVVGQKPINHVMHGLLTLLTLGFWVLVWLAIVFNSREQGGEIVSVDEYGNFISGRRYRLR